MLWGIVAIVIIGLILSIAGALYMNWWESK